jgi:hypothetical protein
MKTWELDLCAQKFATYSRHIKDDDDDSTTTRLQWVKAKAVPQLAM